jgi:Uma2 family endonuclease
MVLQPLEKLYTVEEFEAYIALPENADRLLELIDGEIIEKMPTREHGIIGATFAADITIYLRVNPIGWVAVEARHRPAGDTRNDRLPDVSFVSGIDRPIERKGAALYIPDLCIEIQSPDDSDKDMLDTAFFYLKNGAKMVWLVYPAKRLIEVLTADSRELLGIEDTLTGGDVLPGFSVAVKQLFPVA